MPHTSVSLDTWHIVLHVMALLGVVYACNFSIDINELCKIYTCILFSAPFLGVNACKIHMENVDNLHVDFP